MGREGERDDEKLDTACSVIFTGFSVIIAHDRDDLSLFHEPREESSSSLSPDSL